MSERERQQWNGARWTAGEPRGHYESWFCRANHPTRRLGFWIRYTIFSPHGRPRDAIGELWAIAFDGERGRVTAVKEEMPIRECAFAKSELSARVGRATLDAKSLEGQAECGGRTIGWSLAYTSPEAPLWLLDRGLYAGSFPKAKALVGSPQAVYTGRLTVDGDAWPIDGWIGSQNHNWGSKHTDRYAWGQVAGFDDDATAFLEVATAQVGVGPVLTPPLTVMVLRIDGTELRFNTLKRAALKTRGHYDTFHWAFEAQDDEASITGTILASAADFVGLPYYDPPGGTRTCLNSKIASCALTVRRPGQPPRTLHTKSRAAFEILTDATDHGVPVLSVS